MVEKIGAIERELQEATGLRHVTRGAHAQSRQDYLKLLVEKANDIPDADWRALSVETQEWYNGVITEIQLNPDNPLPDFPVEEEVEAAAEQQAPEQPAAPVRRPTRRPTTAEAAPAPAAQPAVTTRRTRKTTAEAAPAPAMATEQQAAPAARTRTRKTAEAAPAPAAQPAAAAASTDGEAPLKRGAQTYIKQLIIADPAITTAAIKNKVIEEGYKISPLSASTIVSDFRHSLRVLKDTGHLRGLRV